MAIDAYVGLPGHGKSYGVTEHVIIPSLKQGRKIVTNIPLNEEKLLADFGEAGGEIVQLPLDWHETEDLHDVAPPGCVLVLDEVWRRWPAGEYSKSANFQDQKLLAEHRHRVDEAGQSMRVVLVTQDLAQISNWVRLLVESTYRISKKGKKFYVVTIYMGAVTGVRPPRSAILRQVSGTFKKSVFQYYSSATQSTTGAVGDESTADARASILKSIGLWASLGCAFVFLIFGLIGITAFFTPDLPVDAVDPVKSQPVKVQAPLPAPVSPPDPVVKPEPPAPKVPPNSTLWRVAGYISGEGQGVPRVALQSLSHGMRYIPLSECEYYPSGIDVFCDVEGERITPWTGQGAVTSVFQPRSSG